MINNISGVILAGGANSRFNGATKSNIIIHGKTIVSGIIDTIEEYLTENHIMPSGSFQKGECQVIFNWWIRKKLKKPSQTSIHRPISQS
jgi:molybdopterin-guanine dinucleotide biosynthesis protein A